MTRECLNIEQLRDCFTKFKVMRQRGNFHGVEYNEVCAELLRLLKIDSGVYDTFIAMFKKGPLDAGDLPSKGGRDILVAVDMCVSVISKASWHYALVGCLDDFWTYFIKQELGTAVERMEEIKNVSELLRTAMQEQKLCGLKLLFVKVGEEVPLELLHCSMDFSEFLDKLSTDKPFDLNSTLVIGYYQDKLDLSFPHNPPTMKQFRRPEGKGILPEIINFITVYTFKVVDGGVLVMRSIKEMDILGNILTNAEVLERLKS